MQQNKNTKKIELCSSILADKEKTALSIHKTLELFRIRRTGQFFDNVKRCGVSFSSILPILLLMPFYGLKSVSSLIISKFNESEKLFCGKTTIYDLKNNEKISWRSLLLIISLRFKTLSESVQESAERIKAFIADDSTIEKSGKTIEYISRVYDHVSHTYVFGYKILVLGYWDGFGFHPIDFSLHRERGKELDKSKKQLEKVKAKHQENFNSLKTRKKDLKQAQKKLRELRKTLSNKTTKSAQNKLQAAEKKVQKLKQRNKHLEQEIRITTNSIALLEKELKEIQRKHPTYGLSAKEKRKQFKKQREVSSPGYERASEVDMSKTEMVIQMLRRAVRRGFTPDYVLVDTWFCNIKLLKTVLSLKRQNKIHLLAMAKMGNTKYTLLSNNKKYNALELLKRNEREASVSRKHKAKYFKVKAKWDGVRVNLFFVKFGNYGKWRLLITSDLNLSFTKLIEIYQIRWTIEVFFREMKQYLGLGNCISTCFDSQIADITIKMIQYSLIAFHKLIHENQTFGELFRELSKQIVWNKTQNQIIEFFWLIIESMDDIFEIDAYQCSVNLIRKPENTNKLKLFIEEYAEKIRA